MAFRIHEAEFQRAPLGQSIQNLNGSSADAERLWQPFADTAAPTVRVVLALHPPELWSNPVSIQSLHAGAVEYRHLAAAPVNRSHLQELMVQHGPDFVIADAHACQAKGLLDPDCAVVGDAGGRPCHWLLGWREPDLGWCPDLVKMRASGCIEWGCGPAHLQKALDAVAGGELWYPRRMLQSMYGLLLARQDGPARVDTAVPVAPSPRAAAQTHALTAREAQIDALLRRGLSNKEMAMNLRVSLSTVKKHLASVFVKRGLRHRRQGRD